MSLGAENILDFGPVHEWMKQIHFANEAGTWIYNGAAMWSKGSIWYVCRARVGSSKQSYVTAQLFNHDWVPKTYPVVLQIKPVATHLSNQDSGPQDSRVFEYLNKPWIVFNMLTENGSRKMFIYDIKHGAGLPIPLTIKSAAPRPVEKNWTPFVRQSRIHFIYSFVPLVIIALMDIKTGECMVVYAERVQPNGIYRGGTPAIETSPNVFEGYLHSTRLLTSSTRFNSDELPPPAQATSCYYRTHHFKLDYSDLTQMTHDGVPKPKLTIGSEISFFNKQIELAYGWDGKQQLVLNVNDKFTIVTKLDARV